MADDCADDIDPLKLVREGTSQDGRRSDPLAPAYAPSSGRRIAHDIVFAQGYAQLLKFFDETGPNGDWSGFFGGDLSAPLAVAAIEDVDGYRSTTRAWFDFLNDRRNELQTNRLRNKLGDLFAAIGTLAQGLDALMVGLPAEIGLRDTLRNLIRTQAAPELRRLIGYFRGGVGLGLIDPAAPPTGDLLILRRPMVRFAQMLDTGLSRDWSEDKSWADYLATINADPSVFGGPGTDFVRINHCATHNLFRAAFDQFVKILARAVTEAESALDFSLSGWDQHEPHYALYLAFLRLLDYARTSANSITQRHLDFYYRTILGLKEKPAEPGHVHLLAELAKQAPSHDFPPGESFRAGKDADGKEAFLASTDDFVANRGKVEQLKSVYRHSGEDVAGSAVHEGRLFASPTANSDDGLGAPLVSPDQAWHPFFNKSYVDGTLDKIRMPEAEIGFAIASHYLLMAEGARSIVIDFEVSAGAIAADLKDDIRCFLSSEKGWLEKPAQRFSTLAPGKLRLQVDVSGGDPAVVPYSAKIHAAAPGVTMATDLPVLLVKLRQDDTRSYAYGGLEALSITAVRVGASVTNMRTLAVANDFGPVDSSKPFQPFGASPVAGSSLIVGSREIFQKHLTSARIDMNWLTQPVAYKSPSTTDLAIWTTVVEDESMLRTIWGIVYLPHVATDFLVAAQWSPTSLPQIRVDQTSFSLGANPDQTVVDRPDFAPNEPYGTHSRQGFVRLRLTSGFGQDDYQADLLRFLTKASPYNPGPTPPVGPTASTITMSYEASADLPLNTTDAAIYEARPARFFHVAPFGTAEQHPHINGSTAQTLLPQFVSSRDGATVRSEAEFYIGVSGLVPPQELSLLFQVVDGTADPLAPKPEAHIGWSYLSGNRWIEFDKTAVRDRSGELLKSGIVTLAMPREATADNTLLPAGLYWIRAAVAEWGEAVCKLRLVAAQAVEAVFADRQNAPGFSATPIPAGTVSKLERPDAAVKTISQPFASFGGRGAEQAEDFYTRVSERLRHKDRAIDLWDYEHLILEAFPQVYRARCLNHTRYEPSETGAGAGIYRELAAGHVTIVTLPDLKTQQQRDPLKPYTSLSVLQDIEAFLKQRMNCFARLHVRNPKFEAVRVRFKVRLNEHFDEAYYTGQLKQAIVRFLSPWAFAEGDLPNFGGKIYKSVLINFIEDQPGVDYVTDFQLFHDVDDGQGTVDLDEIEGTKAVSILVSAPADDHDISVINPAAAAQLGEDCGCDA